MADNPNYFDFSGGLITDGLDGDYPTISLYPEGTTPSDDSQSTMTNSQLQNSGYSNLPNEGLTIYHPIDTITDAAGSVWDGVKRVANGVVDTVSITFTVGKWIVPIAAILVGGYFLLEFGGKVVPRARENYNAIRGKR